VTIVRPVRGYDGRGRPEFGDPIMCCWNDCVEPGHEEHKVVVRERKSEVDLSTMETLTYIFCCQKHKHYYVHSHLDLGNVPTGYKSVPGMLRY
jgi:hypothetical protein